MRSLDEGERLLRSPQLTVTGDAAAAAAVAARRLWSLRDPTDDRSWRRTLGTGAGRNEKEGKSARVLWFRAQADVLCETSCWAFYRFFLCLLIFFTFPRSGFLWNKWCVLAWGGRRVQFGELSAEDAVRRGKQVGSIESSSDFFLPPLMFFPTNSLSSEGFFVCSVR